MGALARLVGASLLTVSCDANHAPAPGLSSLRATALPTALAQSSAPATTERDDEAAPFNIGLDGLPSHYRQGHSDPLPVASAVARAAELARESAQPVGEWRLIRNAVEDPVALAWCLPNSTSCEAATRTIGVGAVNQLVIAPDRRSAAAVVEACSVLVCSEGDCGEPIGSVCNPNGAQLTLLPNGRVLYEGNGGSGISVAQLLSVQGPLLWSSVHRYHELAPSKKYLAFAYASSGEIFGEGDTAAVLELDAARIVGVFRYPIPARSLQWRWTARGLHVSWEGGPHQIATPGATVERDSP